MARPNAGIFFIAATLTAMAVAMPAVRAAAQITEESETDLAAPIQPLRTGVTADLLLAKLIAHNDGRTAALLDYSVLRTYEVVDPKGKVHAQEIGRMEFRSPDQKKFVVSSEAGSGLVRRLALNPLIASEIEAAAGKEHHNSAITAANYSLAVLGEQQVGRYHCFVAQAIPKRKDKYLFEGKMWIDSDDFAVVRIEGHPAKKLSFWIERADFVRQYQKIGMFWLPQEDETFVQVRLYGQKVLTINHQDYVVNALKNRGEPPSEIARAIVAK
jgi:hypothetical protein